MTMNEMLQVAEAAAGPFHGVVFERSFYGWECRLKLVPADDGPWFTSLDFYCQEHAGDRIRSEPELCSKTQDEALCRCLMVIAKRRRELEAVGIGG